jgi:hypothetical protein
VHSAATARPEAQTASLDTRTDAVPELAVSDVGVGIPGIELSGIAHTSAKPDPEQQAKPEVADEAMQLAAATPELDDDVVSATGDKPTALEQAASCDPELTAKAAPAAMVDLHLSASCLPNARVTIHHNGMMVSVLTDQEGHASVALPALSAEALYIASFENGAGAVARTTVEDLDGYDRVVLQWRGDAGFEVHALEYGADYGEAGHIWNGAPGTMGAALAGTGGFLVSLGDTELTDGLRAEVYTFPTGIAQAGDIVLSAEAVVTEYNCTRDIEAQALQIGQSGTLDVLDLTLTVPSCEIAGDILMLKNLLQDLKIARN